MNTQDGSARRVRVQVVVVRGSGATEVDIARLARLARLARRAQYAIAALAAVAVVLWVIAHLVQVAFAVGLIAYVTKLAGRLVRL